MKNLILVGIWLFSLIWTTPCQQADKNGDLFSHVAYSSGQEGGYATLAAGIVLELKFKNKTVTLTSNEGGVIYESLPEGKYLLLSAKTSKGVSLKFKPGQNKIIKIKRKQENRFDIFLLKSNK
jgi:hypothetical protein